jgi:chromosomal replication initiation ATPase DnaA
MKNHVQIVYEVADYFGVFDEEILSPVRTTRITQIRHLCMWLMRKHLKLSFREVAERMNRDDHTTARNGVLKCEATMAADAGFAKQVREIEAILFGEPEKVAGAA